MPVSVATRGGRRRGAGAAIALAVLMPAVLAVGGAGAVNGPAEVQAAEAAQERADGAGASHHRALIAFLPAGPRLADSLLDEFTERGLATGLTSPTVGGYSPQQAALDLSQGARLSARAYHADLRPVDLRVADGTGRIEHWAAIVDRAEDAAGSVVPGLLATAAGDAEGPVPFVSAVAASETEAIVAADRDGEVERVSLGLPSGVAERAVDLWKRSELVVARLPPGREGLAALDRLLAAARPRDLVYALRAPPEDGTLLATGVRAEGLGGLLTSDTTRTTGLVTSSDLAPTVLTHLGIEPPPEVEGEEVESTSGSVDDLRALSERLEEIVPRRNPTLTWLLGAWLALVALLAVAHRGEGLRAGLRIGFLAALWVPGLALVTGALQASEALEIAILAGGGLALGAVADRLLPWPAAPLLPAAAVLLAHTVDLALGSSLTITSLAGPNPRGGARFYGVGNELETILSITVLLGTGAALALARPGEPADGPGARAGRLAPRAFAAACVVAAAIIGAGRLGAAVGGVITLGAAGAVAVLVSLPHRPGRRGLALALAAPVALLAGLAAIDIVTAGGAHFSSEVIEGEGSGDLLDTVERRLELSASGLGDVSTAVAVAVCAALLTVGVVRRRSLLAPLRRAGPVAGRAFRAGIAGALVATVVGALVNDSGPVIFMIGSVMLVLAVGYVQGRPAATRAASTTIPRCA